MEDNQLIKVSSLVPEDVFKTGGSLIIIDAIKKEVSKHTPDVSTLKGRKEIASLAHKVAQSKTLLDDLGKAVKEKYKLIIDPIDKERKTIRDELDALKTEVRKPLTDWEDEQERIKAEAEAIEKYNADWDQAIIDNDLFNREREIARKEAELKRIEDERKAKEEAERLERERTEREERLKREAAESAKREAEEKAEREKQEAVRKQIEAELAAKKAQDEKEAAELRAKIEAEEAEKRRVAELKAAEERAEREKQFALEAQRKAQEEKERAERERIAKEKAIEEARKADIEHMANINRSILSHFIATGITEEQAKALICMIAKNQIPNISINY